MAYKCAKISPSALAATERCPRFRPDGEENQAAVDGTMFHEFMREMVETVPRGQWAGWADSRNASPQLLGLLESATRTLETVVTEDLEVFKGFRLRMRGGKPRKAPLKPGLYPECELERGQGRHGYIDLMVVTPEGLVYIVDYKSNRVGKDFSWQLGAYAADVNTLCPAHTGFVCMVIAPRLDDEEQLRMEVGPGELGLLRRRIQAIEERADAALWDGSIPSCPGDQCEHCHAKGGCRAQAEATVAVAESVTFDQTLVSARGRETVVPSLRTLVGPGGPYEGEAVGPDTFTNPATPAQRGLRRACLKFIEVLIDKAKEDDRSWAREWSPEQLRDLVPGYTVSWRGGRGAVDASKMGDIRRDVMAKFGLSIDDVFEVSDINRDKLVELLVAQGEKKTAAADAVKKLYEPYTTVGAPALYWTQKPVERMAALATR